MESVKPKPKRFKLKLIKSLCAAVVIVGVFGLGLGFGSGRINIGPAAVFHKTLNPGLPNKLDYSTIDELYAKLKSDFDGSLDQSKLMDGLGEGLVKAAGDPYTEYFNSKDAQQFNNDLDGTFTGIGAELSKDAKNNIVVIAPLSGYPADKAGLKPKDIIAEIDGQNAYDLTVGEAVDKIRGPAGSVVKLKIIRNNRTELNFSITREKITIPSVETKTLSSGIGYIKISRFGSDTVDLTTKAANKFKADGVKGIVVDLRSDPGGLLDAAVGVSSLWLPRGKTILTERRSDIIVKSYLSEGPATLAGIPTVVLLNEGSASASEITAGALKDNGVATLMGVKSFGKGSVQQLEKLIGGGILKVTIARWYTPDGKNIDKAGITPDKVVKITDDDYKNGRDPQLDAATAFLNK
ncbi:MAG TPA: S41 family peptidase [Candidatus Saccharimonadales bacterium]|nr:S41 family peptidase [Candidatus Saccharimonadales bacterium]